MALTSRLSVRVGDVVGGRFRLDDELADGGMSRVYEAVDLKYDRPAAVKVMARWLADDEEYRQRFERESYAAERVTHPHVLPVWDYGTEQGLLYLATPLCERDLGGLLTQCGRLDPARALAIMAQVAWALDWAHGRDVVHRDVKPENVLLVGGPRHDHAYLSDFGLAKATDSATLTQAGHPAGLTPAYAAPEQWRDEPVGPATDQYALAGTLYTCLAGRPPFHPRRGPSLRAAHLEAPPPDVGAAVEGLPPGLRETIARGLAKEPGERFASCRDLVAAAEAALRRTHPTGGTLPSAPAPASTPPAEAPAARPRMRMAALAGLAAAVVVVVVVAVVVLTSGVGGGGERPPATGVLRLGVGTAPIDLAAGAGGVWVASSGSATLTRIAPARARVRQARLPAVSTPFAVAAGGDRIWAVGPGGDLAELDAETGRRLSTAELGIQADGMAVGYGALWIFNATGGTVTRVDVSSGRPGRRRTVRVGSGTSDIDVGLGGVWVSNGGSATLVRLDPRTGRPADEIRLRGGISGVAVGDRWVWVADPDRGRVARVDPRTGALVWLRAGPPAHDADVATGEGAVFYVSHDDGTATRLDATTGRRVRGPVFVTASPSSAVVAAHRLWVSDIDANAVAALSFPAGGR